MRILVACGGNALIRSDEKGTFEDQLRNVALTADQIFKLILLGHEVVVTHGNGPQIGNLAVCQDLNSYHASLLPLHVLGAMTQGQLGYMLQQALARRFQNEKTMAHRKVVSIITQTLVDRFDPALREHTKPIGPFYSRASAAKLRRKRGYVFKKVRSEEPSFRRVVSSPDPIEVVESAVIRDLIEDGVTVIACGGGGVPVISNRDGLVGVDCVIDKDLAARRLAASVDADLLLILTDVEKVKLNFSEPNEMELDRLTLREAKELLSSGCFREGSMAPKVRACVGFIEDGGDKAIITSVENGVRAVVNGYTGTHFVREMGESVLLSRHLSFSKKRGRRK